MHSKHDHAFGELMRKKRGALGVSQMELSRRLKWPQAKVSRVEQGKRSVTLPEMLAFAQVFHCSVAELLGELDSLGAATRGTRKDAAFEGAKLTPGFSSAYGSEDALLAQLERYGVRFLGSGHRPALVYLPFDEVLLAALRFANDPRVFEALPALLLKNAVEVDWTKLMSGAYSLRLQNRLGMVLAAALALKSSARDVEERVWRAIREAHASLAEAKLDREEVVGPRPRTDAALNRLRRRTPEWLSFWHVLGSADLESFRRYLPR
jgi:transcriptional regulator with XRE-family HTH domain